MKDRELCLCLAKALGWETDDYDGLEEFGILEPVHSTWQEPEWLLTPAGAFAVLDAMRERGWDCELEGDMDGWLVWLRRSVNNELMAMSKADGPSLVRAIAEAALAALEK